MKCRMCGFEFDETKLENRGCSSCGKHGCNSIHCPNCGFANSPELDDEFQFIVKLKDKLKENGLNLDTEKITVEEAVEEILKATKN